MHTLACIVVARHVQLTFLVEQLGSVDTQIMKARDNQAFLGQSSARAFAPQPPAYNPASPAYSPCSPGYSPSSPAYHAIPAYCYDAKPKGGGVETVSKKSMSRCRMQPGAPKSVASGHPRVEHLASAALLCSNIRLDASGTAVIKLPADFDGVALVMLTCESSCEWKIVHSSSLPSAPPPTLLQRQLCLNQTFAPESHMCLQVSILLLHVLKLHLHHFISRHQGFLLLVKKCSLSMMLVVSTQGH